MDTAFEQIPIDVLREHKGKWIVWDQEDRRVLGVGVTLEEAEDQADRANIHHHLLRFHHAVYSEMIPNDVVPDQLESP